MSECRNSIHQAHSPLIQNILRQLNVARNGYPFHLFKEAFREAAIVLSSSGCSVHISILREYACVLHSCCSWRILPALPFAGIEKDSSQYKLIVNYVWHTTGPSFARLAQEKPELRKNLEKLQHMGPSTVEWVKGVDVPEEAQRHENCDRKVSPEKPKEFTNTIAEKMEVDAPGNGQLLSPITPIKKFAVIGSGHPHESVKPAEQPGKDSIHVNNGLMEEPMVPPPPPKNIVSQRRRENRTQRMPSPPLLRCIDPRTLTIPHQDPRPLLVSGADRFTYSMKRKRMGMENDTNYNKSLTTQSEHLSQDRISAGSKEQGLVTNADDIPLPLRANKKPRMQEFEETAFSWDDWVTFDNEPCEPNSRSNCASTDYIPIINYPIGKWPPPPRNRPARSISPPSFAAIGAELQHTPKYHVAVMNWGREMENYKYPDGIAEPEKDIWLPYSQLRPRKHKQQQALENIPPLGELTEIGRLLRQYYHQRAGQFILDKMLDAPGAVPDHAYLSLDTQLAEVERRSRLDSKSFHLQPNNRPQK